MSTSQVAPATPVSADSFAAVKEAVAFGFVTEEKDGKKTRTATLFSSVEDAEKAEKAGQAEEVKYVDTVVNYPKTLDALLSIADTPEKQDELVRNHNRGAATKVANRIRAKVLKLNDKGEFALSDEDVDANGILDMTDEILSESKRKTLTEEERIDRYIAAQNFTPEKAAKMKAAMLAAL